MPPRINGSAARSSIKRAIESSRPAVERQLLQSRLPGTTRTAAATIASSRHYATVPQIPLGSLRLPDDYIPPTQPPSARRPDVRKSQLLRTYTSLLRSTPLILFFQHNNLTGPEWAAIRREIKAALAQVSGSGGGGENVKNAKSAADPIAAGIKLQVLRTRIFDVAFKITEFFDPKAAENQSNKYTHDLSTAAWEAVKKPNRRAGAADAYAQISPLLTGPVAAVTFPVVTPAHLAAVLKVLAPSAAAGYPPPSRKKTPGYYEATAQNALQKLLLLGGRVDGSVFDPDGVRWVGGIEGGIDGLRAQLINMLQSIGLGLTTALEGGSKGLWLTLESRRTQLEEEANGGKKKEGEGEGEDKSS
ncbi:hypothetical protein SLS62_005152 [Diatrype stigma]|uniref:Uncharacterized protein n=1 Tax=Diatrype stigma TaxID=117547 RepID=A0AAN9YT10_9PEZI